MQYAICRGQDHPQLVWFFSHPLDKFFFFYDSTIYSTISFIYFFFPGKKPHLSLVHKFKRIERLTEIDNLLVKNKELQDDIARKIEESRAIMNTTQVIDAQFHFLFIIYLHYLRGKDSEADILIIYES